MRIVSLLPSATDTIRSLKLLGSLVGRSHECDWPEVQSLPVLTSNKVGDLCCADTDAAMVSCAPRHAARPGRSHRHSAAPAAAATGARCAAQRTSPPTPCCCALPQTSSSAALSELGMWGAHMGPALLEQAMAVYRVDLAQLQQLRPDVILTQLQVRGSGCAGLCGSARRAAAARRQRAARRTP